MKSFGKFFSKKGQHTQIQEKDNLKKAKKNRKELENNSSQVISQTIEEEEKELMSSSHAFEDAGYSIG